MDNYTLAVPRSQGGRLREVCYENNNYRIQVWNVEIRRERGREGAHLAWGGWWKVEVVVGRVSTVTTVSVQHYGLL